MNEHIAALTKWPNKAEDMTVDLMLRIIGADTQVTFLRKLQEMDRSPLVAKTDAEKTLYLLRTSLLIGNVGLMLAIRQLREIDPEKALTFVRDYWGMCDDGSEFGPALWEWLNEAGLDPDLIKLPAEAAHVG